MKWAALGEAMGPGFVFGILRGLAFFSASSFLTSATSIKMQASSNNLDAMSRSQATAIPSSALFQLQSRNSSTAVPKRSRVLCWIPSKSEEGVAIETIFATWASHCDELVFISKKANPARNVVAADVPPLDPEQLWNIVTVGWRYAYSRINEFDWFVKLDDDTYFICDNFKVVVRELNPNDPHYLGHTSYHHDVPFNLGAGHAISRGTLAILGLHLPGPDRSKDKPGYTCSRARTWAEDLQLRRCLDTSGVGKVTDSKDKQHRETFLSWHLTDNFISVRRNDSTSWFWKNKPKNTGHGTNCCSTRPVLWHNLKVIDRSVRSMFEYEYWFYKTGVDPLDSPVPGLDTRYQSA